MEQPLVSFILPCYNHERYVEETIRSVYAQTYKKYEVIVCDDASKDKSPQLLQKLQKEFGFTLILHEQNQGLPRTLNELIPMAQGKYIKLFATDDILEPNYLEVMINEFEKRPEVDVLFSSLILINEEGLEINRWVISDSDNDITYERLSENNCIYAPSAIVKSNIYSRFGLYDEQFKIEDWSMWLKIAQGGGDFKTVKESLVRYRQHQTNASRSIIEDIYIIRKEFKSINFEENLAGNIIREIKAKHNVPLSFLIKVFFNHPKVIAFVLIIELKNFIIKFKRKFNKAGRLTMKLFKKIS